MPGILINSICLRSELGDNEVILGTIAVNNNRSIEDISTENRKTVFTSKTIEALTKDLASVVQANINLQREIAAIRTAIATPSSTVIWSHGSEIQPEFRDDVFNPESPFMLESHGQDGLRFVFQASDFATVSPSIRSANLFAFLPTPTQLFGRSAKLRRIFLRGESFGAAIVSVQAKSFRETLFQTDQPIELSGSFSEVAPQNTFTLDIPKVVDGVLVIRFRCEAISNSEEHGGGEMQIFAIGAEFES